MRWITVNLGVLLVVACGGVGELRGPRGDTGSAGADGQPRTPTGGTGGQAGMGAAGTALEPGGGAAGGASGGASGAGVPLPPGAGPGGAGGADGLQLTAAERDLIDAINAERMRQGKRPVQPEARLLCAARRHALDVGQSGACGHVGTDGSWPWDRAMACGYPQEQWTVNEIAAGPGFSDGADAVWGWSQSPGHYAGLLHDQATRVGVGVHRSCYIALFDCCVAGS